MELKRRGGGAPALTREQGAQIVARRRQGETRPSLAEDFGVSTATIDRVMSGRYGRWRVVRPPAVPKLPPGARLDRQQVDRIRELRGDGLALRDIAEQFGVAQSTVSRAARGLTHGPAEAR